MKNLKVGAVLCAFSVFFAACIKDPENVVTSSYESGVFIAHEGAFSGGTGTVSFYNRTMGGIKNDIFAAENNGAVIGNILQSMTIVNTNAYLLVNNANRIVVANAKTFKYQDSITATTMPRYLLDIDGNKGFVSEWGANGTAGAVKVLDYANKRFTKTIPTGKGAERMLKVGNTIWVVNHGGFGSDSTVAIVDIATETVTSKINVGVSPNSLVQDANGDIWVLSGGAWGAPNGKLVQIRNNNVIATFNVPQGSNSLITNVAKNSFYFIGGNAIYQKDLTNTPPTLFVDKPTSNTAFGALYGLGLDPKTSNLYLADAKNYSSAGTVYIFNASKTLADSMKTGIVPSNFWFTN
jgi:YVTN family beta-propeller protein